MNPRTKIMVFGIAGLAALALVGYIPATRLVLYHRAVPDKATFVDLSKVPAALNLTDLTPETTRECDIGYARFDLPNLVRPKVELLKSGPGVSVTADRAQFYFLPPHTPNPNDSPSDAYFEHLYEIVGQKKPQFMKAPRLTFIDTELAVQYTVPLSQWRIATMSSPDFLPYIMALAEKPNIFHDVAWYFFLTDQLRGLLMIGNEETKGLFAHAAIESRDQNWTVGFYIYNIGTNQTQVLHFASTVLAHFRFTDEPYPSNQTVLLAMVTNAVRRAASK